MDLWQAIDAYCERTGPEFWSEPVNALTNLAFVIAALVLYASWSRRGGSDRPLLALIALIAIIGIGSFLFHTFANGVTALADTLPIMLFIYGYFFVAMRRFFGLGRAAAIGATAVFLAASFTFASAMPPGFLNGSAGYLPALFALLVVGFLLRRDGHGAAGGLLLAALVFTVSLTARTIDESACAALPLGTHFLWHCLNALVLYMLVATCMKDKA